jgi:DNA mismatch repair protein MutS
MKKTIMEQWQAAKSVERETILFFGCGDFYELFFDDAKIAARVLGLTLTSRDKRGDNPIPMAGFPRHQISGYLLNLAQQGYCVAVCEAWPPAGKP